MRATPRFADLTPMGKSFYSESRYMTNDLIKTELGVKLKYVRQYYHLAPPPLRLATLGISLTLCLSMK